MFIVMVNRMNKLVAHLNGKLEERIEQGIYIRKYIAIYNDKDEAKASFSSW